MEEPLQGAERFDRVGSYGGRFSVIRWLRKFCDREWSNSVAFVVLAMAFFLALFFSPILWRVGYAFANVDPLFYFSSFTASLRFGDSLDLQTFAFGQGFGTFQHPTILNVFWWVFALSDNVQVAYAFTEISLFLCVLTFSFWLSRNLLVGIGSGILTVAIFFVPGLLADHFGSAMPQHILQIALCYLALALIGFGWRHRGLMAAGALVLVYVALMDWLYLIFVLPLLGLGFAALCLTMICDGWRAHRACLFSTLLIAGLFVAFLFVSGIKEAYEAFTLMSARAWIPSGLLPRYPLSLVMFGGVVSLLGAYVVGALSIVGMIYFVARDRRHVFFFSSLILAFLAVLVVVDVDSTGTDIYWTLPAIGYFERPLIPFYAIVIVYGANQGLEWLLARRGLRSPFRVPEVSRWGVFSFVLAVMASCGIAFLMTAAWVHVAYGGVVQMIYRPPHYWERTTKFVQSLPFRRESGPSFQPYFYDATQKELIYQCTHLRRDPRDEIAVRYCGQMFSIVSVPNFIEFQNLVDLQTARLNEQAQLPQAVAAGNGAGAAFDRLRSFGIRYVAVDGTIDGAIQALDIGGHQVSLVDLGPIKPDDLSVRSLTFDPVYRRDAVMAARERHVAVVHEKAAYRDAPLAAATRFELTYRPGGVAVHVQSGGDSVVLLPFQFSHCLRLAETDRGGAELIMVNGGQAALRFAGEANVVVVNTLRYFGNAGCRRQDFIGVFRHGIWPVNTIDELAQGRRIPFLMKRYLLARFRYRDRILQTEEKH